MAIAIRLMYHMAMNIIYDVNETHNMLNWVNDEGYTHATIRCEAYSVDDYHGAWFGGYWYPDI